MAYPYVDGPSPASAHAMPQHRATGAETSAAAGLIFGKSITFQHVGGASPVPPHALTNSPPGELMVTG